MNTLTLFGSMRHPRWKRESGRFRVTSAMNEHSQKQQKLLLVLRKIRDGRFHGKVSEAGRFRVTLAMNEFSENQLKMFGSMRNPR